MVLAAYLLARKPIAQIVASGESSRLVRSLGPASIAAIGIGAIIGAGIFVLTGTAAANYAGPAIMLSFTLAAVACLFVGRPLLRGARLHAAGERQHLRLHLRHHGRARGLGHRLGPDPRIYHGLGRRRGRLVRLRGQLVARLRVEFPPARAAPPGWTSPDGVVHGIVNLPPFAIVLVLTGVLVLGTRESSRLNNVMVSIKLVVVVAFVALGAFYVDPAHWHPFIPPNTGQFGHFGLSGILRGASVIFFAILGFDTVSTTAQEALRPQRDVPIGILASLAICTVLYVAVAAVLTGVVPFTELDTADPIARGVDAIGFPFLSTVVKAGALTGLIPSP
jgi:APA family basic amino acid/polyamine antiporter